LRMCSVWLSGRGGGGGEGGGGGGGVGWRVAAMTLRRHHSIYVG
jgi:hypothetical protein